jgi:hypothetical protein
VVPRYAAVTTCVHSHLFINNSNFRILNRPLPKPSMQRQSASLTTPSQAWILIAMNFARPSSSRMRKPAILAASALVLSLLLLAVWQSFSPFKVRIFKFSHAYFHILMRPLFLGRGRPPTHHRQSFVLRDFSTCARCCHQTHARRAYSGVLQTTGSRSP